MSEPNRQRRLQRSAGGSISLSLLDLLYVVPVADLATRISSVGVRRTPLTAWGGVAVSLAVIIFSWLGYHRNRNDANERAGVGRFGFLDPRFAQFLIEVVIVGAYFVLGLRMDAVAKNGSVSGPSAVWEASWLLVIYGLYLAWDLLDVAMANCCWKSIAECYRNKTLAFLGIFAVALGFAGRYLGHDEHSVFYFDVLLVALLFLYRAWQDPGDVWLRWFRSFPMWLKRAMPITLVVGVVTAGGFLFVSSATYRLRTLTISPPTHAKYNRVVDFGGWITVKGCNTRAEVLIRTSQVPVTYTNAKGCRVKSGRWTDPWSGTTTNDAGHLQIDHTVPLANAWTSGAQAWTQPQRVAYANDLTDTDHLVPMTARDNESKGNRGPDRWKPSRPAAWCRYGLAWDHIKAKWHLSATRAEWNALKAMVATC